MDALTLDQFKVFLTILEEGSFAAASRRLGRAQSAVSYAVQKLEDQIGLTLFDRSQYRPALTEAGSALVPKIRRILEDVDELRMQAQTITIGVEPQVTLVLDNFLPISLAVPTFKGFREAYPFVKLQITSEWTDVAARSLIEGRVELGIFPEAVIQSHELEISNIGNIELVAVAAPDHPLASKPKNITRDQLLNHHQIIVRCPADQKGAFSHGMEAIHHWDVSDNQMQHDLICAGLGWGTLPRPIVADDLREGTLIELQPERWDTGNEMPRLGLILAKRKDKVLGPAATLLMSLLSLHRDKRST